MNRPRNWQAAWLFGRLAPVTTQRMPVKFVATQRALQAARADTH
ncbi:MAG: hypothetical protein Q7J48_01585 [Nocardioides sp.]|nr:hypothetical protein [Nocardioides sp.]